MKNLFSEFEQQNTSTLIIIGNGLDIACGIESSYHDFYLWLIQNGNHRLINLIDTFFSNQRDVWGDIEKALGEYKEDEILEYCKPDDDVDDDHFMSSSAAIEDSPDWIFQPVLDEFIEAFKDWVNSINIDDAEKICDLPIESRYLTFNYTETLEKVFGIEDSNILHIHGSRLSYGEKFVIGHDKYRNPDVAYKDDSKMPYIQDTWSKIIKWMNGLVKNTATIISKNKDFFNGLADIKQVGVYGHSFYEVDWPYLEKVVKQTGEDTPWLITYHTDEDLKRIDSFRKKVHLSQVRKFFF